MNSLICLPANETGGPSACASAAAFAATKSEAAKSDARKSHDAANRHCRDFAIGVIVDCDPQSRPIDAALRGSSSAAEGSNAGGYSSGRGLRG
jgi:hypothetical protein